MFEIRGINVSFASIINPKLLAMVLLFYCPDVIENLS